MKELQPRRTTFGELMSLSLGMSVLFGFVQIVGFAIRILFRQNLGSDQYGIFAFLINLFVFLVTMNGFSMHVPIISRVSERPADEEFYNNTKSQVLSLSLILGAVLALIFVSSTHWAINEWLLVPYLAALLVLYSTSQIIHCFPRGRERFKPASVSLILVGIGRIAMLILFLLVFSGSLTFAILAYTLPFLGWWASYLHYDGIPSLSRPQPRFMLSLYRDAFISYLYPLGTETPIVLGIVLLTSFHGFGAAGDFDIALMPYSGLAAFFTGISFVTLSKARKLPEFRSFLRKTVLLVTLSLGAFGIITTFAAVALENTGVVVLSVLGLPSSIYWPMVMAAAFGIPVTVVLSLLVSYFHGRGIIKPVGVIVVLCSASSIPFQIALAYFLSVNGVVLSVILVNLLIVLSLVLYGYYKSDTPARPDDRCIPNGLGMDPRS